MLASYCPLDGTARGLIFVPLLQLILRLADRFIQLENLFRLPGIPGKGYLHLPPHLPNCNPILQIEEDRKSGIERLQFLISITFSRRRSGMLFVLPWRSEKMLNCSGSDGCPKMNNWLREGERADVKGSLPW